MNYQKIYESIIENAKSQNRIKHSEIYYESHHIIPKCLGGNDEEHNRVLLTAKEHYICHKLLIKIYPGNKSIYNAFYLMSNIGIEKYNVSSRDYEYGKKLFTSLPVSEKTKYLIKIHHANVSGENNPRFGKHLSPETKIKVRKGRKHKEPWNKNKKGAQICSKETREKMSNTHKGKKFTAEHRKNLSQSHVGYKYKYKNVLNVIKK